MATTKNGEHNRVLALFLCLGLFYFYKTMVWDPYFNPARPPVPITQTAPAPVPSNPADKYVEPQKVQPGQPAPTTAPQGYPADAQVKASGTVVLETEDVLARVSLLGGRLTDLRLKKYATTTEPNSPPLSMVDHVEFAPYPLGVYSGSVDDGLVQYRLKSAQQVSRDEEVINHISSGLKQDVVLEGTLPDGRGITKTISFDGLGYFMDVAVKLSAPASDSSRLSLEWTKLIAKDSPTLLDPYKISGYVWFDGQKALRETFDKLPADHQELSGILWLSMADKYFLTTLLSTVGPTEAKIEKSAELYRARLSGEATETKQRLFAGPKNYRLLQELGSEMQRNVDLGWTAIISVPLLTLLHAFHDLIGNFGLAIVLLTIAVKLAMYPLTASSFKQMKALQDLAPDLKRIRETVSDKQQQQMQTMQLYKEKGVNPLGGCLPILMQMPVFIGLYQALLRDIELRHAPFALWIHDLSAPEKLHIGTVGIPVMVILFVISMLVQQWITPSTADPAQKRAMLVVPLVFGFLFSGMPAGLTLYWLTNNLISIGQQSGFRGKDSSGATALKRTLAVAGSVFLLAFVVTKLG